MDRSLPRSYIFGNLRKGPIMRQPELGKKILELRKEKGLTQEELVEKRNISVRTLQRIETGEVTPRVFTSERSSLPWTTISVRSQKTKRAATVCR